MTTTFWIGSTGVTKSLKNTIIAHYIDCAGLPMQGIIVTPDDILVAGGGLEKSSTSSKPLLDSSFHQQ